MAVDKVRQRHFVLGAVLEFVGIVALAARFGPEIGGTTLFLAGAALIAIGFGLQLRALLSADTRR